MPVDSAFAPYRLAPGALPEEAPPPAAAHPARQRLRVAEAARAALRAGFAGICLDRPDAPLALGLLGAGFCPDCQRDLGRHLAREYGDHFQPEDYLDPSRACAGRVGVLAGRETTAPPQPRPPRHVDAAVFPAALAPGASGIGLVR